LGIHAHSVFATSRHRLDTAKVIGVLSESHKPHRSFRVLMGDANQKGRSARAALWFYLSGAAVPQLQSGH